MASLSDAKSLGGIGAILAFFPAVNVVGWILILFAIRETSEVLQDRTIFDDAIIAALASIIGSIAFVAILFGGYFGVLLFLVSSPGPSVLLWAVGLLLVAWTFGIVSAVFLKRAYDKMGQRLGVGAFATTGILYLVGSLLTVVIVGILIVFIALIFQAVAFFSIHDQPPPMSMPQQLLPPVAPPPQTVAPAAITQQPQSEVKYCFRCGAKLESSALYCNNCGTKQP
jgi:uncharacterized membrane protein/ribosomal protein L40E